MTCSASQENTWMVIHSKTLLREWLSIIFLTHRVYLRIILENVSNIFNI